ncbi:MAG: M28 family peptidase [Bacteroidia bacterium]
MKNFLNTRYFYMYAFSGLIIFSCNNEKKISKNDGAKNDTVAQKTETYKQVSPNFNADSAYYFVQKQCDFGPRVTNSVEAKKCGDWLVSELKKYTDNVIEQKGIKTNWDGKDLRIRNIIAEINPKASTRVLLCSHWDSRPVADKDNVDPDKPILGANDGASGVGVLLEIAKVLKANPVNIGVDIILFDAEDLGRSEYRSSYCLGTQYWTQHLHHPNYTAQFGILLDMVGGKNATFAWEENSVRFARPFVEKIWGVAQNLGYDKFFVYVQNGGIEDDHFYINKDAKIPTVDIIQYDANTSSSFPEHHHTHRDNMNVIDSKTLKAVGQTLLELLYMQK